MDNIGISNEWVTIKKACSMLGKNEASVRKYSTDGLIQRYKSDLKGHPYLYSRGDILCMLNQGYDLTGRRYEPEFGEFFQPLFSYHRDRIDYFRYGLTTVYEVSNHGTIVNRLWKALTPSEATHGYMQVFLSTPKGGTHQRVHRLVASIWCPNSKHKGFVHHIDFDKKNNQANNLLWVTLSEHNKLHNLHDNAQPEEYISELKRIEQENSEGQTFYKCIVDPECDDCLYQLTDRGYHDYIQTGYLEPAEIICQWFWPAVEESNDADDK